MNASVNQAQYELRFQSLFHEGRGYSFPCDASGHVDLDALGSKARLNYFYARTVIGREFSMPAVLPRTLH
ncbi:hypothetical protein [Piscinibacter sp. XHJ-5]|uniref:hypothetical protein n=1 Tax=Piscinibacter sp. XHJ-5 TaxID=3037797 RepID=UPI0024528D90|nr:hypothetical protein [Piscinibacter sp. XHJ-5]